MRVSPRTGWPAARILWHGGTASLAGTTFVSVWQHLQPVSVWQHLQPVSVWQHLQPAQWCSICNLSQWCSICSLSWCGNICNLSQCDSICNLSQCGNICSLSWCGNICNLSRCGNICNLSRCGNICNLSRCGNICNLSRCGNICNLSWCGNICNLSWCGNICNLSRCRQVCSWYTLACCWNINQATSHLRTSGTVVPDLNHSLTSQPQPITQPINQPSVAQPLGLLSPLSATPVQYGRQTRLTYPPGKAKHVLVEMKPLNLSRQQPPNTRPGPVCTTR